MPPPKSLEKECNKGTSAEQARRGERGAGVQRARDLRPFDASGDLHGAVGERVARVEVSREGAQPQGRGLSRTVPDQREGAPAVEGQAPVRPSREHGLHPRVGLEAASVPGSRGERLAGATCVRHMSIRGAPQERA